MLQKPKYKLFQYLLAAINFVAVVMLVFSLLTGIVPPSILPFFSVFALLFPPILFINLMFIFLWVIWRKWMVLLSLIPLILGFGTLCNNFQLNSSDREKQIKDTKVLTYNVQRFGLDVDKKTFIENKKITLEFVQTENPDILCLQEFHGKGTTLYEPLQQMKSDLNAVDYYYESYFNPRYNQLTGLVIFSKYEAVNKGKLKFEGSRTFGIYTDLIINKDTVRVYNIHLASIQLMHSDIDFVVNPGKDNEEFSIHALKIYDKLSDAFQLREHQMDYLLIEIKRCPYPIILSGDFNDTPSSYIYKAITKELQDTFTEKGNGFSITYAGKIPFLRIDYVMKSEDFSTLSYQRHKVDFSDHYPVSVSMRKE